MIKHTKHVKGQQIIPRKVLIAVVFLMLLHFYLSYWFGTKVLGGIPHIPDSVIYYRQGSLLSEGNLFLTNFSREPYEAFEMREGYLSNGTIRFSYNHFWPAMLAVPIKFGLENLLNPLLSSLSLLLVFLIATELYNYRVGVISAVLYSISPFTIIMAGEFMNHTPTQFFLLAAFYLLILYVKKQNSLFALFAGTFIAYAFGIRQLTTVAITIPLIAFFLIFDFKKVFIIRSIWFLVGFFSIFSLFFVDNYLIRGSAAIVAHPAFGALGIQYLDIGLNAVEDTLGGFFPPILFYSFVPMLIVSLAFIPLIILRKKEDYLLIALFISLVGAHSFFHGSGVHGYGPRYFFETFFVFYILIARTILWTWQTTTGCKKFILIVLFGFLFIQNLDGLRLILPSYKNYNGMSSDLFTEISNLDLPKSIVVVTNWNWQGLDINAKLWDPEYKRSFFIRHLPENKHYKVLMDNPQRKAYIIQYDKIVPYDWNTTAVVQ